MLSSRPLWFDFPEAHIREALNDFNLSELRMLPVNISRRWTKVRAIGHIYGKFVETTKQIPSDASELAIKEFFMGRLGEPVVQKVIHPPCPKQDSRVPPIGFVFRVPGPSPAVTKTSLKRCLLALHPGRRVPLRDNFADMAEKFYNSIFQRTCMLRNLTRDEILSHIRCYRPAYSPSPTCTTEDLILFFLRQEYEASVVDQFIMISRPPSSPDVRMSTVEEENRWWKAQDAAWPHPPDIMRCIGLMKRYRDASCIKYGAVCSVCSRKKLDSQLLVKPFRIFSDDEATKLDNLRLLTCLDSRFESDFVFEGPWSRLSGLMLDPAGMTLSEEQEPILHVCVKCESYLNKGKMPMHAWANGLYRGKLPVRFSEMTWVEEKACAAANTTAHVIRLYNSPREDSPKVFYGNVCAHDANIVDFASVLPRTPQDINDCITVVFIGPEKYKTECIKKLFYVRKELMLDFLRHMKYVTKHPNYVNIEISEGNLALFPDADSLPGSLEKVIHDTETQSAAFQQETAGPDAHPAEALRNEPDGEPIIFMEKVGVSDPDAQMGNADVATAYGLRNMYAKKGVGPDVILQRSREALPEYHNPALFPALFPTLFPYGTGGFDDKNRSTSISFQEQANLFLDTVDRSCRYHHSFIFVVCNIMQRRAGHMSTYLTVHEERFEAVAKRLVQLDEKVVLSVADRLEHGIKLENLTRQEQSVMELLKEVRTAATRVPGSFAGKLRARTEIRNYMAFFNLPVFFFTTNPNAVHSPLFQVMYGDETVDLDERFPCLVKYNERARRVAHDPVAAADFFEVSFKLLMEHLLGWDFELRRSRKEGGLLGHVAAWYEMSELTGRGGIHGHTIVCVRGSLNPSELHARLREDSAFEKRVCEAFESMQWHSLPDVPERDFVAEDVRCERPPAVPGIPVDFQMGNLTFDDCFQHPSAFCARLEVAGHGDLGRWWMEFLSDVKTCGEKLQRHTCRDVCFKYGHDTCRFRFPHEVIPRSHFDAETNSLRIRVLDPLVNWLNLFWESSARQNHDLQIVPSGATARAATYYITDYITKMEEKTHYIVSLFSRAVQVTKSSASGDSTPLSMAKMLLQKCLAQLTSRQQIHAQQAAWYVRGHGDAWPSHQTVPMLSASLIHFVKERFAQNGVPANLPAEKPQDDSVPSPLGEEEEELVANSLNLEESGPTQVRLVVDLENKQVDASNQVQNYFFRDSALKNVCFYDFVHRFRVEKKTPTKGTAAAYRRFILVHPHRQKDTHEIVEHTNYETQANPKLKVPVVYGCSIPRSNGDRKRYCMFVLAHFKPFGPRQPLLAPGETWETTFESFSLCELGQRIVRNWDALYECEDEREQERRRKRDNRMRTTKALRGAVQEHTDLLMVDEMAVGTQANKSPIEEFLQGGTGSLLCSGGWIGRTVAEYRFGRESTSSSQFVYNSNAESRYDVTPAQLSWWTKALKEQEKAFLSGELARTKPASEPAQSKACVLESMPPLKCLPVENGRVVLPESTTEAVTETPAQIIARIGKDAKLNPEQYQVYEIAANAYVRLLEERRLGVDSGEKPLSMFVNGPGGTGKTYAIQTFQKLMAEFRCGHRIKYTAPSGAAASLIHGVTLHSGLKIRVFKGKEKGGQYSISLTAQQKAELQNEFLDIDVLVVDEVSMVSAALMAQIDASTRIAKNNDQPFGGMITIFSGDFFQFPPVAAFALYDLILDIMNKKGSGDYKLQSKLGRIAWKHVDTVIELFRQERMKADPIFGDLVLRLRRSESTAADVALLNTRVIRSHLNPTGVCLDSETGLKASTVIVRTNEDRLMANYCKAIDGHPELVMCAARDYIDDELVQSPLLRSYLLKLDMTKDIGKGALPPYVPLYRGMPVIMRRHNQAACLGIANGAQGFLRDFQVEVDDAGYTFLKSSIVEFPDSEVDLPGLPAKHVALPPWKHSFQTAIPGSLVGEEEPRLVTVVRHLTDFDPSFAITAHCAQGKTLNKVIGHIKNGGPAAYVTISRARRLQDLILLSPVSQAALNHALNNSLLLETRRLEALQHNTLIRYGYQSGDLVEVYDADLGNGPDSALTSVRYTWEKSKPRKKRDELPVDINGNDGQPGQRTSKKTNARNAFAKGSELPVEVDGEISGGRSQKRKRTYPQKNGESDSTLSIQKRQRFGTPSLEDRHPEIGPLGCRWDRNNWSCAYDCLITCFYALLHGAEDELLSRMRAVSDSMKCFLDIFETVKPDSQIGIEEVRERSRGLIHSWDQNAFLLYGNALVAFERIMFILTDQRSLTMDICVRRTCDTCNREQVLGPASVQWPTIMSRQLIHSDSIMPYHSTQEWLDVVIDFQKIHRLDTMPNTQCCDCLSIATACAFVIEAPPLVYFERQDANVDVNSKRSWEWQLPTLSGRSTYTLHAIIYLGGFHFTCRFRWNDRWWFYDGQSPGGMPSACVDSVDLNHDAHGREAHLLIYSAM